MTNPILIEVTRGTIVESEHRGAFAVARSNGEIVLSAGNIARPIYPRSAIKAFQAVPLIETGTAEAFSFGPRELALACASHSGADEHAALSAAMLARAGMTERTLCCGPQWPLDEPLARKLAGRGLRPDQTHNNCSGKHAGMVAACVHCGDPVAGYTALDHPHQRRIAAVLAAVCGDGFDAARVGVDGCSAPNWAIPVGPLATAFARFITGERASPVRRGTYRQLADACMAHPHLVAGAGRFDTKAMSRTPGKVFTKTGAEGVFCGAFPELGLGFAVKIDDGHKRAAESVTEALTARFLDLAADVQTLEALGPQRNWAGTTVGAVRMAEPLQRLIAG